MSQSEHLGSAALNRTILAIALPSMLTNVATAMFGVADTWVIGRLGDPAAQGAVEVGAKLMMTLLVVFNFLRTGTVGLVAQATGSGDEAAQSATLARALAVALGIGALLLIAWPLVVPLGLKLFSARGALAGAAATYVDIRYVGGVAWLINAVLIGWLIGRRRVRAVLAVEVGVNIGHVALDVGLVLGLGLGVAGVAAATLMSETARLVALIAMTATDEPAHHLLRVVRAAATWRLAELTRLFRLNRDLFIRTLLLMTVTVLVTRTGAQQGAVILAANAILLQLFSLATYVEDGFESAAQVLCGEALGARDAARFTRTVRQSLLVAGGCAALIALAYLFVGRPLATSFTTSPAVAKAVTRYAGWAVALPLAGVVSFVLDGVFVGSSWTRAMLGTMALALAAFSATLVAAQPLGNDGLWLAFTVFFLTRAAGQAALLPRLTRRSFAG